MKVHTVFLKNLDISQSFSHLVGSFDSKDKYIFALQEIEKELDITLHENDYEVFETELNQNFLLFSNRL